MVEKMLTDTEIRVKGIEVLMKELGEVEAERFITLLIREPFDYTEWQQDLWVDIPVDQLSKRAMKFIEEKG